MNRAAIIRNIVAGGLVLNLATTSIAPRAMAASSAPAKIVAQVSPPAKMRVPDDLRAKVTAIGSIHPQRPALAARGLHVGGIRVAGPTLLKNPVHPKNAPLDPYAMSAKYRQMRGIRLPQPIGTPVATPPAVRGAQSTAVRTIGSASRAPAATRRVASVSLSTPSLTGINHYWTYEEDALPGVGKYMANVGNGNLIIQADDMAVPHKGVALAFRRTYNSLSQHDYFGSDGSQVSNYGAGWTNTFDAHLAANSGNQYGAGLSVYDIDGARYDYLPDGQGHWIPPAGQFATLTYDGGNGYFWTKKSGTVYYFLSVYFGSSLAALEGRLVEIYGRNNNTHITFSYAFQNGDPSCSCNLTDIFAMEEDGRYATLAFSDFTVNGQPQRLLSTLTWPDGTIVAYNYDTGGNLSEVDEPPNNTSTTYCHGGMSHCLPELYVYYSGSSHLYYVVSPRYMLGLFYGVPDNTDATAYGSWTAFGYDANGNLTLVGSVGYVRPTPADGTNTPIQPGADGSTYRGVYFYNRSASNLLWADSDNHITTYTFDGIERVTQMAHWTGTTTLNTTATWDAQDNLIATTDARGYETDYAYDGNGNSIAAAGPSVTTSLGTFRPTTLYSYDANNNIVATCDQTRTHALGMDWAARPSPSDSLCPAQSGATLLTWTNPSYEPFGELTTATSPLGYHHQVAYNAAAQGGADYGLPTSVTGDSISQADSTTRTPQLTLAYDIYGNGTCEKGLNDPSNPNNGWSARSYDGLGRVQTASDPDDASQQVCGRTGAISGTHIVSTNTYYPNGQVATSQSPSEAAASVATSFQYDADGNEIRETHHFANMAADTNKYYDGADRLVEIVLPHDATDYVSYSWMTRYRYDLTLGGTVSVNGSPAFSAYGNLFSTQVYNGGWIDTVGQAFDALDRGVGKYKYFPLGSTQPQLFSSVYDSTANSLGLLSSAQSPVGDVATYTYDAAGRATSTTYSGPDPTPSKQFLFDPNGRVYQATSSTLGTSTYQYNADGFLLSKTEGSGGSFNAPAVISYAYYPDGMRSSLSVAPAPGYGGWAQSNLFSYSYRSDGAADTLAVNYPSASGTFSYAHTPGGRELSMNDPYRAPGVTRSYNSFGNLASATVQSASYTGYTYDAEGELTTFQPGSGSTTVNYTYNSRGENIGRTPYISSLPNRGAPIPLPYAMPALGAMIASPPSPAPGGTPAPTNSVTLDARNGVATGVNWTSADGLNGQTITASSDNAGRRGSVTSWSTTQNAPDGSVACTNSSTSISSHTFDAEDHLLTSAGRTDTDSQRLSGNADGWQCSPDQINSTTKQFSYSWSVDGHPAIVGMPNPTPNPSYQPPTILHQLHWDGDTLLFVSDANGNLEDLKIGALADITPQDSSWPGFILADRDPVSGALDAVHNVASSRALPGDPGAASCQPNPVSSYEVLWMPRTDGICNGQELIQGERAVDPATSSWMSPDVISGDVSDPASQRAFMYNNNNPVGYSDPSGFAGVWITPTESGSEEFAYNFTHESTEVAFAKDSCINRHCKSAKAAAIDASLYFKGRNDGTEQGAAILQSKTDAYDWLWVDEQGIKGQAADEQNYWHPDPALVEAMNPGYKERGQLHTHTHGETNLEGHWDDYKDFFAANPHFLVFTAVLGNSIHRQTMTWNETTGKFVHADDTICGAMYNKC